MKHLLVLLMIWSAQTFAQETCSTLWVYKPYAICEAGAGPDTSVPGALIGSQSFVSQWIRGGASDQLGLCASMVNSYNADANNRRAGLVATLTQPGPDPALEQSEKRFDGRTYYKYTCPAVITQYPYAAEGPSPACGVSDRHSYQIGNAPPAGQYTCLTCDPYDQRDITELVSCLRGNIINVVNARAVELRPEDLDALKAKVLRVLDIHRNFQSIPNLQTLEEVTPFLDFVR